MLIRRDHFQSFKFSTEYRVCGEDVELCLNLRSQLKLDIIYCPLFSGEHGGEATRSKQENQQGNSEDLTRIRSLHARFLQNASQEQLLIELEASVSEADTLRSLESHRQNEGQKISDLLAQLKEIINLNDGQDFKALLAQFKQFAVTKTESSDLDHWKSQTHALQLARLKLEQKLKQAQRGA